jgi:hypothetical protein
MILIISSFVLVMTILTGCVSQKPLTKKDKESIRSVSIKKDVKIPDEMYYRGPAQYFSIAGGIIGAAAGAADAKGAKDQIRASMLQNQIDLGQIIREQLEAELIKASVFHTIVSNGGDAEVRLEATLFGFDQTNPFSTQLKPALGVIGSLVRTNGTVLWQKLAIATNENQTPAHSVEEYLKNPQLIREAFNTTAKIISEGLVKDMRIE